MTVKELISMLLGCDMSKKIILEVGLDERHFDFISKDANNVIELGGAVYLTSEFKK